MPIVRELLDLTASARELCQRIGAVQSIRLMDFDLRNDPRLSDPLHLLRYQAQVSSQSGENGVLHEIFRRTGTSNRVFAEIGVGAGPENNTAYLLSQGWTGFWIDGADSFSQSLRGRRNLSPGGLKTRVSFVTRENACQLFEEMAVPIEFDLLSLDIDQNTFFAWEGLARYRPRVVVAEYNRAIPADVDWTVNYDDRAVCNGTQNFGRSSKAFENLGRRMGYSLVGCEFIGLNAFFVRSDLTADKFAAPFTAENHYEPPRYPFSTRRCHPPAILDRRGEGERRTE